MTEKLKLAGLSSSTLKFIAMISMTIDHIGVGIYTQMVDFQMETYQILRYIGRIAFPIYCFLLIEGYFHTKDIRRYVARVFLFGCISEIPFNMVNRGVFFDVSTQNVYFTLALGLLTVYLIDQNRGYEIVSMMKQLMILAGGALLAEYLEFDYHYMGVLMIALFYYLKEVTPWVRDLAGAVAFSYEVTAPIAFIPIHFYNGKRGLPWKYMFYWFYPMHLLVIGCIRMFIVKG